MTNNIEGGPISADLAQKIYEDTLITPFGEIENYAAVVQLLPGEGEFSELFARIHSNPLDVPRSLWSGETINRHFTPNNLLVQSMLFKDIRPELKKAGVGTAINVITIPDSPQPNTLMQVHFFRRCSSGNVAIPETSRPATKRDYEKLSKALIERTMRTALV